MAGRYDFTIEQGATFERVVPSWTIDGVAVPYVAGMTAALVATARGVEVLDYAPPVTDNGSGGVRVDLGRTDEQTAALDWDGRARYNLEVSWPTGEKKRLLEGFVRLSRETVV